MMDLRGSPSNAEVNTVFFDDPFTMSADRSYDRNRGRPTRRRPMYYKTFYKRGDDQSRLMAMLIVRSVCGSTPEQDDVFEQKVRLVSLFRKQRRCMLANIQRTEALALRRASVLQELHPEQL